MTAITCIGSTDAGALNGANVTLTYPTGTGVGDCSIVNVTLGTSKSATLSVTSSSGGAGFYTQIVSTIQSSNVRFGVFRRIITSTAELACIAVGTGGSTDSTSAIVHTFRYVDKTTPEDVAATSTNGGSTSPNSPSITVATSGCAIITSVGAGSSLITLTPGSGSSNNATTNQINDTRPAINGQAWGLNNSTAAFDPAVWVSSLTVTWISATVALRREFDLGFSVEADSNDGLVREMQKTVIRSY